MYVKVQHCANTDELLNDVQNIQISWVNVTTKRLVHLGFFFRIQMSVHISAHKVNTKNIMHIKWFIKVWLVCDERSKKFVIIPQNKSFVLKKNYILLHNS